MMTITSKLPTVGTTIFTAMSQLAVEYDAINLAQGFPNFPVDQWLKDRINHYVQTDHNQYAPMTGVGVLREAIARKKDLLYDYRPAPETEITITNGATEGIYNTFAALVHPGDEVIVFEPAYDCYVPAITVNGGVPVPITLRSPTYRIDWDQVRDRIGPRTRMIVLNTPHNPTGTVLGRADMEALRDIVRGTNLLILADEVYQHLCYDGKRHESVLRYPDLYRRAVVTMSFGKTFHATGWRIGYAIAPPELTTELRKVHQFNTFSINRPLQHALADYLSEPANYRSLPAFYQRKRDLFVAAMRETPFTLLPCAGTYFVLAKYRGISSLGDQAFARWLTREKGVAVIPISSFYTDGTDAGIIRFCFAKTDDLLLEAANRLQF
ncbi:MAG: methionine aminotransferase [Bacteroidota bacterium]